MRERIRILVVDDDELQRKTLAAVLSSEALYEVSEAEDGPTAFDAIRKDPPSVVISDVYMPGFDGVELCRRVKSDEALRDSMFLLLTGSLEVSDKVRGLDSGADDYVTKPVHADELLSRVRACLRLKSMHDELKHDRKVLAELNQVLAESYSGVLHLLIQLIGIRIPNATARAERAEKMSRWMGERMQLSDAELHILNMAAKLREIGKISLRDELLKKEYAALTETDRNEMIIYPTFGELILNQIPALRDVATLVRHQLENFDGTGYPDKLMSHQIPVGARILRTINFIEHNQLKRGLTGQDLVDKVRKVKGTVLDPHLVQLAEEYVRVVDDPSWGQGKQQVSIIELQAGMVLAHDLITGSGTKLLPKDMAIGLSQIEKILAHHHFDPIINTIYIYNPA
jgi:putative two-component system response regulator